jgi:TorA maturation chaperone TorD
MTLTWSTKEIVGRRGMYHLLARLWLREVDQPLLCEFDLPPLRDAYLEAGGLLPLGQQLQVIEQLAMDYCRLFVGPTGHLPPLQSVWQSGRFEGAAAESMATFVEVIGYDSSSLPSGTMLDHLGVQLDVMGYILGQVPIGAAEWCEVDGIRDVAQTFFAAHLSWPGPLLQLAQRQAETDFYRRMIMITRQFLHEETSDRI